MRKLIALAMLAAAALVGPVRAADLPYYPPVIEVPDVDYGVAGNFYLRGSAAGNLLWAHDVDHNNPCGCLTDSIDDAGYGYSLGAGFGYETGTGLRTDFTVDYLSNKGLSSAGYELNLRSTLALVNVYYDFGFSGVGSAAGGFGAYVGAGLGAGFNHAEVTPASIHPDGDTVAAAAAVMAGVSYDMGSVVTDLGYRGIYMPTISNGTGSPYYINNSWIHELRATVRYRF